MLTGAALATINRIPVLLLPSGTFATRVSSPVLQELEQPYAGDVTVNDAFRPLSKYFDRVSRPEQLASALLNAMRVLTDPAETGAVTLSLPQDVQAEAFDWPVELFAAADLADQPRAGRTRPTSRPRRRSSARRSGPSSWPAAECTTRRPRTPCARFASGPASPSGRRRPARARCRTGTPRLLGAVGSTGTTAANAARRRGRCRHRHRHSLERLHHGVANRVPGQGRSVRQRQRRPVRRRQARGPRGRRRRAGHPHRTDRGPRRLRGRRRLPRAPGGALAAWDEQVEAAYHPSVEVTDALADGLLTQGEVLGAVNELTDPRDVVLCAAGSMPGDLHKLWRVRDRKAYHVEYGYSCMGYEIPASIGIRLADETRDVFAMVGDGGYLMMPTRAGHRGPGAGQGDRGPGPELRVPLDRVAVGVPRLPSGSGRGTGCATRRTAASTVTSSGSTSPPTPRSLGAHVIEVHSRDELQQAVKQAKAAPSDGGPVVIHVETDPFVFAPDSEAWWDVPGQRGLRAGHDPRRPPELRAEQDRTTSPHHADHPLTSPEGTHHEHPDPHHPPRRRHALGGIRRAHVTGVQPGNG